MRTLLSYFVYAVAAACGLFLVRRAARDMRLWGREVSRWHAALFALALGGAVFVISEPRHMFEDFVEAYYAGGVAVLPRSIADRTGLTVGSTLTPPV